MGGSREYGQRGWSRECRGDGAVSVDVEAAGPRIVVVGSTMIDLVAFAERLPEPGETLVGTRFLQGFGGKGANQAVAAARFGATVALVNAVGDDPNGRAILANLAEQGVDTHDVHGRAGR